MDIGAELALQVFSTAKKVPMEQKEPRLFDEAQSILYKGPLPYTWQDFLNNTLNLKTKAELNYHVIVCFVLFLYFFFSSENVAKQFWGVYLLLPEFVGRTLKLTQPFSSS